MSYNFQCREGTTVCHTEADKYHKFEEPSCSDLKLLGKSPREYKAKKISKSAPEMSTEALKYGTLLHVWGELGPAKFWPIAKKPPLELCTATGAMGAKCKPWIADQSPTDIVISPADFKKLKSQTDALLDNEEVCKIMQAQVDTEFNIRTTWNGHRCRSRVDGATEQFGFDWKTTSEKYPSETWAAPAKKYGYHMQSAMYTELLTHVGFPREPLRFIVTSTVWPYENFVTYMPDELLQIGYRKCMSLLEELESRLEWDNWQRYDTVGTVKLKVPSYLLKGD